MGMSEKIKAQMPYPVYMTCLAEAALWLFVDDTSSIRFGILHI